MHTLGSPAATVPGLHETEVVVGSITVSTATPHGPPGSLMKLVCTLVALFGSVSSARPIEPLVWSTQYTQDPEVATPLG